ncbi:hypothetical protein Tco_0643769 [Tanacetum coccineum]
MRTIKSAISLCCNNVQHSQAKYIDVRYHFIKEQIKNGIVELYFDRTEYQLAASFTNLCQVKGFNFLIEKLSELSTAFERRVKNTFRRRKALDDALVDPVDRLEFRKCNMRLMTDIKTKEAIFQVMLDTLVLTLFYQAFLITTEVPAIYMQEFWATVSVHKSSIRFMINKKKFSLDVEIFSKILHICPNIPGHEFEDLLLEHDILTFIKNLGYSGDIIYLIDGMFNKKNIDYVYLPWEDLLFHIENKEAKKTNKMSYPRFTKIVIDYFMLKDQFISRRNKMFWHSARDDTMFTSMRCISRHEDTQVYEVIIVHLCIKILEAIGVSEISIFSEPTLCPSFLGLIDVPALKFKSSTNIKEFVRFILVKGHVSWTFVQHSGKLPSLLNSDLFDSYGEVFSLKRSRDEKDKDRDPSAGSDRVTKRRKSRNKTAYTSYSDPHGIIYVDQYKRKRLMHADELHKFRDGTLNDVRSALHNIAAGIRMEYPPMRK